MKKKPWGNNFKLNTRDVKVSLVISFLILLISIIGIVNSVDLSTILSAVAAIQLCVHIMWIIVKLGGFSSTKKGFQNYKDYTAGKTKPKVGYYEKDDFDKEEIKDKTKTYEPSYQGIILGLIIGFIEVIISVIVFVI